MGSAHTPIIRIADDDALLGELLEELISSWGMKASATVPICLEDLFKGGDADIYLIDIHMAHINGIDWIPEIRKRCPQSKVIIMTGAPDKEAVLRALRHGAFDFLEKPIGSELLHHSITRAMEMQEKERNTQQLIDNLKQSQAELMAQKERLEFLNKCLIETSQAFSVLTRNLDLEREEIQRKIAQKIGSAVMPAIDKLRRESSLARFSLELDLLRNTFTDLTSDFSTSARIASVLTSSELRIASLVKGGFTSEQIAEALHLSPDTVRTHRKNIRKKLKINSRMHTTLKGYLLAQSGS